LGDCAQLQPATISGAAKNQTNSAAQLDELADYLSRLHRTPGDAGRKSALANRAMRALNHLHIFDFPLQLENDFDLDASTLGLNEEARSLKLDEDYV
jgi:5-methylthioribose kinase